MSSHPEPVSPSGRAAFFDVDNTVMRGASLFHLARGMRRRKLLTYRELVHFGLEQLRFVSKGEHVIDLDRVRARALSFVAGYTVPEIRRIGEEIYDELMASKIWPGTRALATEHLRRGDEVWLVTATPDEIAATIADRLGVTGGIGTVAEHIDGVYTGRLTGQVLHGEAKAEAIRGMAERRGFDLSEAYAYSDSANDIPMLSLVGHPFAVNPDLILGEYAREHGWEIRDFRKRGRATRRNLIGAVGVGAVYGGYRYLKSRRGRGGG